MGRIRPHRIRALMPRTPSDRTRSRESPNHLGPRRMWCMLSRGPSAKATLHSTCMSCSPGSILLRLISSEGRNLIFWMVRPGIISLDLLGSLIQFSLLHRRATHFLEPATGNRGRLRYAVKLYPRGFPWLNNRNAAEVQASNFLIDQCLHAAALAATAGNQFLLEHPEDLGLAPDGLIPASIWSWPELLDLLVSTPTVVLCSVSVSFRGPFCQTHTPLDQPACFPSESPEVCESSFFRCLSPLHRAPPSPVPTR